jgi:acyl-CoA thioesterase-2
MAHFLRQLELDRLDRDLFLGDPGKGEGRLFGGLVAAQSVMAAHRTVEDGAMHSLHAYFLRPGRHGVPIRYVVQRIRDGRTFTTRDVVAYQAGEAIFNLSCSFARPEEGLAYAEPAADAPPPEGLPDWEFARLLPEEDRKGWAKHRRNNPIEMRACDPYDAGTQAVPRRRVWMRARGELPEDPAMHAALIAYASDSGLIATARRPHGSALGRNASASLDHAMWFHHQPRFDDWLLYTTDSPVAQSARALIFGQMYRRDGARAVSVVQEGLIRIRPA